MSEARPFFIVVPWEFYDAWLVDRRVNQFHVYTALARRLPVASRPVTRAALPCRALDGGAFGARDARDDPARLHDLRAWGWPRLPGR